MARKEMDKNWDFCLSVKKVSSLLEQDGDVYVVIKVPDLGLQFKTKDFPANSPQFEEQEAFKWSWKQPGGPISKFPLTTITLRRQVGFLDEILGEIEIPFQDVKQSKSKSGEAVDDKSLVLKHDSSSSPPSLQVNFWKFTEDTVGSGFKEDVDRDALNELLGKSPSKKNDRKAQEKEKEKEKEKSKSKETTPKAKEIPKSEAAVPQKKSSVNENIQLPF